MNEKKQQRKWVREEVVILVTEYFKNKNLAVSEKQSFSSKLILIWGLLSKFTMFKIFIGKPLPFFGHLQNIISMSRRSQICVELHHVMRK